jgi:hypothetical protein
VEEIKLRIFFMISQPGPAIAAAKPLQPGRAYFF